MIRYKCLYCNTHLETPDEMGGKVEKCPSCGRDTAVPLSKAQTVEKKQKEKVQRVEKKRKEAEAQRLAQQRETEARMLAADLAADAKRAVPAEPAPIPPSAADPPKADPTEFHRDVSRGHKHHDHETDIEHTIMGSCQLVAAAILGGIGGKMMAKEIIREIVTEPNVTAVVIAAVLLMASTVFLVRGITHLVLGVLSK